MLLAIFLFVRKKQTMGNCRNLREINNRQHVLMELKTMAYYLQPFLFVPRWVMVLSFLKNEYGYIVVKHNDQLLLDLEMCYRCHGRRFGIRRYGRLFSHFNVTFGPDGEEIINLVEPDEADWLFNQPPNTPANRPESAMSLISPTEMRSLLRQIEEYIPR
jgi:hypothetical protein